MEIRENSLERLMERVEAFTATTFELSKFRLLEAVTRIVASLIPRLCVWLLISMFFLVLSAAVALFLGELLGKKWYGLFIVAAFYLMVAGFLQIFLRKKIKKAAGDFIIKQVLQ